MKKIFSTVLLAGILAFGGAFAQVDTSSLQAQVQTVSKLIQLTTDNAATRESNSIATYPYLLSKQQIEVLLPYLREVRALSALSDVDVSFYTAKIAGLLTDAQRNAVQLTEAQVAYYGIGIADVLKAAQPSAAAAGSSVPSISGGGSGGTGSSSSNIAVVANPMIQDDQLSDLDQDIITLTLWQSNFGDN